MGTSRSISRHAAWAPALAIALSVLLVAGQTLNCCRLNETLSASIGQVLKSLAPSAPLPQDGAQAAGAGQAGPRKTHAGCHGHGPEAMTEAPPLPVPADGPLLQADEPCLSEIAFAPKALQPLPAPEISFPLPVLALVPLPSPSLPSHLEKPRPQNKSSPPVYLLTLRLLV